MSEFIGFLETAKPTRIHRNSRKHASVDEKINRMKGWSLVLVAEWKPASNQTISMRYGQRE
ncbi:hypothetical protein [Nitrosomonas nitrosa]|uniref:hypothetical protein n=1 Tax=Nitrosomonas nitrosa TaxID=52442 RepID=UPI0023F707C2|nr:hypothetical protein [Nitrosomonas nitrosa]MCO6435277.1 hypothetical protein [Nitrosomonas nitrosa]